MVEIDYYVLAQNEKISNCVQFELKSRNPIDQKIEMNLNSIKSLKGSFNLLVKSNPNNVYPDFIETPFPLISNEIKKIFSNYESHMQCNCVILSDQILKVQHIYWLMLLEKIDCIDEQTEFYKDNSLKHLVLNKKKIGHRKIFWVGGIREKRLVINLDVAESLLRRPINGITLERTSCN